MNNASSIQRTSLMARYLDERNLGFQVDEVAAAWMSPRTIERYVSKVLNSGDVKAGIIGRPANSVAMHSHLEFFIMEELLQHSKKTLSEIARQY